MEELIFFAVIIALSIIDSIARKAKARSAGRSAESESPSGRSAPAGRRSDAGETRTATRESPSYEPVPTYDAEASYDSEWTDREVVTYDDVATATTEEEPSPSSAGMIPQDLWEEIAGLARGRAEPAPVERPSRTREPAVRRPREPAVRREREPTVHREREERSRGPVPATPAPVPATEVHPIHLTHAQFGTDPSERVVLQGGTRGARKRASADVRAVRAQLGGDTHALRRAVILREVLGPPASLREDRLEDLLAL